jgi:hypothetical protein
MEFGAVNGFKKLMLSGEIWTLARIKGLARTVDFGIC